MSGTNQFLPFATGGGANVLTPSAYAALTTLVSGGFQSGVAPSQQVNTPIRQSTFVAAAVAQLIANASINANDDGNLSAFVANLTTAIGSISTASFNAFGSSLAFSGYQKLPSGLIIQWGQSTASVAGSAVTFPIAFPMACYAITTGIANNTETRVYAIAYTVSGFTFGSALATANHFWIAIGK